jgi:hypothetical protein
MATISLFVLPSVSASRRSMSRRIRSKAWFVPVTLVLLFCSCGGGGGGSNSGATPNGTPVGTYNLTVSAVSGSNTQSSTLTLIVSVKVPESCRNEGFLRVASVFFVVSAFAD